MNKGYDNAAFFYDLLSRLVFGNKLQQAQSAFLHLIPQDARILIVGGGSGWILEEIARIHPNNNLSITYVEASPKMTALAQRRIKDVAHFQSVPHLINFITAPIEEVALKDDYDVIITAFFFDNFNDYAAGAIAGKLTQHLVPDGVLIYTDFANRTSAKYKLLLKAMYLFFGLICGVGTNALPDMFRIFDKRGFVPLYGSDFMNGFIESRVYIKSIT